MLCIGCRNFELQIFLFIILCVIKSLKEYSIYDIERHNTNTNYNLNPNINPKPNLNPKPKPDPMKVSYAILSIFVFGFVATTDDSVTAMH